MAEALRGHGSGLCYGLALHKAACLDCRALDLRSSEDWSRAADIDTDCSQAPEVLVASVSAVVCDDVADPMDKALGSGSIDVPLLA